MNLINMSFKILPDRLRTWHCLALLFMATFGVYFNSLDNGLVAFDDTITLSSDSGHMGGVKTLKLALGKARHDPKIAADILFAGRPLTTLTKALDKKLFGNEYSGHRLHNIAWHFLAAWFALLVAAELTGSKAFGLAAALVFALHPVQTESVAYLAGRRDVLCGALSLASLYLWLLGARTGRKAGGDVPPQADRRPQNSVEGAPAPVFPAGGPEQGRSAPFDEPEAPVTVRPEVETEVCGTCPTAGRRAPEAGRRGLRWGAVAVWVLAMTAKQAAITMPLLWMAAGAVRETNYSWRAVVRRHAKLLAALGAVAAAVTANQFTHELRSGLGSVTLWYGGTPLSQWLTEPRIVLHAITLLLWPARLSMDYSYRVFEPSQSFLDPRSMGALLVLFTLGWLAWRLRERCRLAAFGMLWIALSYAPMLPILPAEHNQQVFAEHWLYLPVFGFALLLASAFKAASENFPRGSWACLAVIMALYGTRTVVRNRDWKDDVTLWSKTVQTYPQCARSHAVLGRAWLQRGEPARAESELRKALELGTDDPRTFINLAYLYRLTGRFREAEEFLMRACKLPLAGLFYDVIGDALALVYYQSGDIEKVRRWADEQDNIGPYDHMSETPRIIELFGLTAARFGDIRLAEALFLMSKSPDEPFNLGSLYFNQGRLRLAVPWLEKAILSNPSGLQERLLTGLICLELGRIQRAELHLGRAVQLAPNLASGWLAYSQLRGRQGRVSEALAAARKAVRLEDSPRTRSQLEQALQTASSSGENSKP
ncbi:MAG: CDC27 family protein [bacterium]